MSKFVKAMETGTKDFGQAEDKENSNKTKCVMNIQGYPVKGLSIAGHETCIIDRKSTRLNSSHPLKSRMPSSA